MTETEHKEEATGEETPIPPLVTMGDPQLGSPSAIVPAEVIGTDAFYDRLDTLARAMVEYQGIGIAAPQIGWYERFFVMACFDENDEGGLEGALECWINPEIVAVSEEENWAWEGCLSVPGLRGWIKRPAAVAVRGVDQDGEALSREYSGWDARVFQHEFDHLDGMLFPYRALDPRHVMMIEHLATRTEWPTGWPAPGARETAPGGLWEEG